MTDAERAALKQFYELNKELSAVDEQLENLEWLLKTQNERKRNLLVKRVELCEHLQRTEQAVRDAVRVATADVTS